MSEIIQPVPGQTVIKTDSRDRDRGYRDGEHLEHDIYRAVVRNGESVLKGFGAGERQASEVETRSTFSFGAATRQVSETETRALVEAAKNAAAIQVQSDRNAAQGQIQAQTFAAAGSVEAEKNANALGLQGVTFFNAASVEAAKYANAATLQAQELACAAAKQAAECCCELKEKIGDDGQKTRDLINQIDRERGARDLVNANNEILYLRGQMRGGGHHQ